MNSLSLGIITMIIFILLGILMFLVVKYYNKKYLKIILSIVIIIFTLYTVIFSIDYNRVTSLKEPIFAKENGHMGSMIKYNGLGYKIGLEKDVEGNILQSKMSMFGKLIVAAIT